MANGEDRQRVAFLGAHEEETELLAELHRNGRCDIVGLYDPDPGALGLPLAEIMGIPAGSGPQDRQRLAAAEYVVLPRDRMAVRDDVEWCSGLRAQLVSLEEARQRWGHLRGRPADHAAEPRTQEVLEELQEAGERLRSPEQLADWLLDVTMPAIGATGGSVQLLSGTGDELYLIAARGLSEHTLHNARRSLGEAVSGLVAATRQARILHGEHGTSAPRDRDAIHSAVSLPLELEDGTLIGVLNLSTSVHGQHFHEAHVRLLQKLAPRCALLLDESMRCVSRDDAAAEKRLVDWLAGLEDTDADLAEALQELCRFTRREIGAESLQLLVCRAEGEWLPLAQDADDTVPVVPTPVDTADQVLLDRRWTLVASAPPADARQGAAPPRGTDPVETALAAAPPAPTVVHAPLIGTSPLGLVTASFASGSGAERFLRIGERPMRDLALILESRLRHEEVRERVRKLSRLAHALPELLQASNDDNLPREILEQAQRLVEARCVSFRHVDMPNRRYSPPVCLGVAEKEWETWRKHDAALTEQTLQRNESRMTARIAADDERQGTHEVHTTLSIPIRNQHEILGVLNVYDKETRAPWADRCFNAYDRDMLESLAALLANLLSSNQTAIPERAPSDRSRPQRPAQH